MNQLLLHLTLFEDKIMRVRTCQQEAEKSINRILFAGRCRQWSLASLDQCLSEVRLHAKFDHARFMLLRLNWISQSERMAEINDHCLCQNRAWSWA